MLEELFKAGYLNFEKLIINNFQLLNISAKEAFILIEFGSSYLKYDGNVYEDKVAEKLNMDANEVSNIIARFLELNILDCNYVINKGIGQTIYTLSPLFKTLESKLFKEKNKKENSDEIITYLESKLLRPLSSQELDKILYWKDDNISLSNVKDSVEKLSNLGHTISIVKIEKMLYQNINTNKSEGKKSSKIKELLDL